MRPLHHRTTIVAALALAGIAAASRADDGPPPAPREFRAAWVATVANIDWPSRPGLSTKQQQDEAIAILDRCVDLRLNAVIFQVRTAADALYASDLEPWSAVLTGEQGVAPDPPYDPLAFWCDEAHRRGLLLHAWFNPLRAKPAGSKYDLDPKHVGKAHPDWVREYGGMLWMDPAVPEVQDHAVAVVEDVVRRYDVDGVHIDDYFYPYPVASKDEGGGDLPFPDEATFAKYRDGGGPLDRADWRRDQINRLVRRWYEAIHATKPRVLFGISPFGIRQPGTPPQVKGFDQFASLYADTTLWLNQGWCDYWTPQLYWKIDAPGQPFRPLLADWIAQNTQKRHLWPGLSARNGPDEIAGQVGILRETEGADGAVVFSMKALMPSRPALGDRLRDGPFRTPALVPTTPWIASTPPPKPVGPFSLMRDNGHISMDLRTEEGPRPFLWATWTRRGDAWTFALRPATGRDVSVNFNDDDPPDEIVVAAVDRLGNLSERATLEPNRKP